ncbi:MAG: hypothetical protein PHY99_09145 [Bacteroidales bacterium]|nr:hypothetical protein [Bacteroidales bacterium]
MIKLRWILGAITFPFLFFSCDIINPAEDIPCVIKIDTVLVKVTKVDQGSASHNMSCVKITVGGTTLGFFELPTMAPCLKTGSQSLYIEPSFRLNGIAASREVYPFFKPYTGTSKFDLIPGETITITPTTTYEEKAKFIWLEDFEDAGVSFRYATYSDTTWITQNDTVKDGRYSGAIYLDSTNRYFEAYSGTDFERPNVNSEALLEFDYFSTVRFELGVYTYDNDVATWNSLMIVRPCDHWNRIYVDIHTLMEDDDVDFDIYRPGIRTAWDSTGAARQSVLMDNLKLIHF